MSLGCCSPGQPLLSLHTLLSFPDLGPETADTPRGTRRHSLSLAGIYAYTNNPFSYANDFYLFYKHEFLLYKLLMFFFLRPSPTHFSCAEAPRGSPSGPPTSAPTCAALQPPGLPQVPARPRAAPPPPPSARTRRLAATGGRRFVAAPGGPLPVGPGRLLALGSVGRGPDAGGAGSSGRPRAAAWPRPARRRA